jgi:DNA-binding transcriptional regulator GbsR (MarR family)
MKNIKRLKYLYGIIYAFKSGDSMQQIAEFLGTSKGFIEETIRQFMNGDITKNTH